MKTDASDKLWGGAGQVKLESKFIDSNKMYSSLWKENVIS